MFREPFTQYRLSTKTLNASNLQLTQSFLKVPNRESSDSWFKKRKTALKFYDLFGCVTHGSHEEESISLHPLTKAVGIFSTSVTNVGRI